MGVWICGCIWESAKAASFRPLQTKQRDAISKRGKRQIHTDEEKVQKYEEKSKSMRKGIEGNRSICYDKSTRNRCWRFRVFL